MNEQLKGVSPEMSTKILNYVNARAKSPQERQAMIDDMLPEAIEHERQAKTRNERDKMKSQLREQISKETRTKEAQQLQFGLRKAILSDMVRDYAKKNGGNLKGLNDDAQLLDAFLEKNPEQAKSVEKYMNGELSNVEIGKRMGFISYESQQNSSEVEAEIQGPGFWRQAGQVGKNIVGGVYDSITGVAKFAGKGIGNAIAGTAKFLGANEEKVDKLNQSWKDSLDGKNDMGLGTDVGQDKDSLVYQGANMVADVAQIAAPGGSLKIFGKGAQAIDKGFKISERLPAVANFIQKAGGGIEKLAEKAPLITKMLKSGAEGVGDMVLFNIIHGEGTTLGEAGIGGAVGGAFPLAGKALSRLGNKAKNLIGGVTSKLELSGNLNPAKLEAIQNQLIVDGAKLPGKGTPQDVGQWMLERGFKGSKETLIQNLTAHAQKSKQLVDELLSFSSSRHSLKEADQALELLYQDYAKTPGLASKADEILSMVKDDYTLSEMNQVKRYLDEAYNMFKQNGGETAGLRAEGLRNIRSSIKNLIEEVAEKEKLGNIKMLNNETQIARGLADGIGRKESASTVRELLSPFSSVRNGAMIGGIAGGGEDMIENGVSMKNLGGVVKGAIFGGVVGSTKFKTTLANMIKGLGGIEKKELSQWLASNGTTQLSQKSQQVLLTTLKEAGENIDDLNIGNGVKSSGNLHQSHYNPSNNNLDPNYGNYDKLQPLSRNSAENGSIMIEGSNGLNSQARQGAIQGEFGSSTQSAGTSGKPLISDNPNSFRSLTEKLKTENPKGAFMDLHSVDEYAGYKNLVSPDQQAVISVKPDGDIINFISNGKGSGKELMFSALENGGTKMDNYGDGLVGYYEKFGFEPVARVKFNPEYAPEGWNFKEFGQPDIFVMKHNGDDLATVKSKFGTYPQKTIAELDKLPVMEYDEALKFRDSLLEAKQGFNSLREGAENKSSTKISKLIGNSLENNYNGVKPNRLDGEMLSLKEAETLLTKSGKNLNERIMIGLDKDGNLVLEDGRHLLEAYKRLGKEIPNEKIGFNSDKAKKLFDQLYSQN